MAEYYKLYGNVHKGKEKRMQLFCNTYKSLKCATFCLKKIVPYGQQM